MRLREDKTLETALRFVGISIGLCAIPALVSRIINSGVFIRLPKALIVEQKLWLPDAGLTYSSLLVGSAVVLIARGLWLSSLLLSQNRPSVIRLGEMRFWVSCIRAVGVSAIVFGAAWFGHAVFRRGDVIPAFYVQQSLREIRWEFVGAVFSLVFGGLLTMLPQIPALFFDDSELTSDQNDQLSDRRLLDRAIWIAVVFALSFRAIWVARITTWMMEDDAPWYQLKALAGEAVGCICCYWVLRRRDALVRWWQPLDFGCPHCGLDQASAGDCPECVVPMRSNSDSAALFTVNRSRWRNAWTQIVSLTMLGWVAAVAATRGSTMVVLAAGNSQTLPHNWLWSFVMAAGAPVLAVISCVLFIAPGSYARIAALRRSKQIIEHDTLTAVGLRISGLIMSMQTTYLSFLLFGYALQAKSGSNRSFYPSGLVAAVQCFAAFAIACWLFRRSHVERVAASRE